MLHKVSDHKYISDSGVAIVDIFGEWFPIVGGRIKPEFRFASLDDASCFFQLERDNKQEEINYLRNVYSLDMSGDCLHDPEHKVTIFVMPEGYMIDGQDDSVTIEDILLYLDSELGNSFDDAYTGYEGLADITSGMSLRDLTKKLVRVRSSNIWSRGINIKDVKDKFADVFIQFKGKNGGPGDIYQYFDVPINLWRKWLSAPSAGHFFWVNIRNKYLYRKLTGDRKGKLRNAIN